MPRFPVVLLAAALAAGCGNAPPAGPDGAPSGAALTATSAPPSAGYVFPVATPRASYAQRHAGYPAADIFAACGSPVVAVTDGTVLEVSRTDKFNARHPDGALKGGRFVSLLGADGVRYYGSHLTAVHLGIEAGVAVRAGQRIGTVGRSGNASNVCHLHFGISPQCAGTGDWWVRRGVVWPGPYLDAWRRGTARSPAAEITAWQRRHGCPSRPPA